MALIETGFRTVVNAFLGLPINVEVLVNCQSAGSDQRNVLRAYRSPLPWPGRGEGEGRCSAIGSESLASWQLEFEPKLDITEADAIAQARTLLSAAVERRLISEVPLGAFLSGGIDSSIVVALMAEQANLSSAYSMSDQDARGWYVYNTLKATADRSQAQLQSILNNKGISFPMRLRRRA